MQKSRIFKKSRRAQHNRAQRIIRNAYRKASLVADTLVEVLQKSAAPREHEPTVTDVRREFWWGAF